MARPEVINLTITWIRAKSESLVKYKREAVEDPKRPSGVLDDPQRSKLLQEVISAVEKFGKKYKNYFSKV